MRTGCTQHGRWWSIAEGAHHTPHQITKEALSQIVDQKNVNLFSASFRLKPFLSISESPCIYSSDTEASRTVFVSFSKLNVICYYGNRWAWNQGCPQDVKSQDRDETETFQEKENVSRLQCRSLKTPTGEVCHFTNCFLRVRSLFSSWYIRKPDALHACSQD